MALRVHKREKIVNDAEVKLLHLVIDWLDSDEANALTEWEGVQVMSSVFNEQISNLAKYAIRKERHGHEDKPGGLE